MLAVLGTEKWPRVRDRERDRLVFLKFLITFPPLPKVFRGIKFIYYKKILYIERKWLQKKKIRQ